MGVAACVDRSDGRTAFGFLKQLAFLAAGCVLLVGFACVPNAQASKKRYAAIVMDHNSGKVLYGRNADATRYPASLTKIMTLYLVFRELNGGKISLEDKLFVTRTAAAKPPSKLGLKAGKTITVRNAIRALVTKSANDAAAVIAENFAGSEARFAEVITSTARRMGMSRTTFKNASGLPNSQQVTTARDMAVLSRRIMDDFPKLYKFFKIRHFKFKGKRYRNHNSLLFNYRGTNGIKTGYTRASGFNLAASVQRGRKHLVAVVMGGRSARKRNAHMRHILNRSWSRASKHKTRRKPNPIAPVAPPQVVAQKPATQAQVSAQNNAVPPLQVQAARQQTRAAARPVFAFQQAGTAASSRNISNNAPAAQLRAGIAPGHVEQGSTSLAADGPYHVQIGAFENITEADARLYAVHATASDILRGHSAITVEVPKGQRKFYRARFSSFSERKARSACKKLRRRSIDCIAVPAN